MQATASVAELAHCVYLSRECAARFVQGGGPGHMLHFMRGCNRSAPHLTLLRSVASETFASGYVRFGRRTKIKGSASGYCLWVCTPVPLTV